MYGSDITVCTAGPGVAYVNRYTLRNFVKIQEWIFELCSATPPKNYIPKNHRNVIAG